MTETELVRLSLDVEARYLDRLGRHEEAAAVRARVPIDDPDVVEAEVLDDDDASSHDSTDHLLAEFVRARVREDRGDTATAWFGDGGSPAVTQITTVGGRTFALMQSRDGFELAEIVSLRSRERSRGSALQE